MGRGELRLALIGTGYLGGSFALALKKAGLLQCSRGYDTSAEALRHAVQRNIVDESALGAAAAVADADVVVLATPVGAIGEVASQIAPALAPGALVLDLGSTKAHVVETVGKALKDPGCFIGAHPIAGREFSGCEHADAKLFDGHPVILTPSARTHATAIADCVQLWSAVGARVVTMDAAEHDRVFGVVSHLPHVAAFALAAAVAGALEGDEAIARRAAGLFGGGFADTTRVAASSPSMWRDILVDNREVLRPLLARLSGELREIARAVDESDGEAIAKLVERAARGRALVMNADDGDSKKRS